MKQHITIDQLNQLSNENKVKLREWWKPQMGDCLTDGEEEYTLGTHEPSWTDGDFEDAYDVGCGCCSYAIHKKDLLPLLTIGQMIALLVDHERPECDLFIERIKHWRFEGDHGLFWASERGTLEYSELCDALWEAVTVVLEEK